LTTEGRDLVFQALRLAIASHYSEPALERWAILAQNESLDWVALARMATVHDLAPLLNAALQSLPASTVPPAHVAGLKQEYQTTATYNMLAEHDLIAVLRNLALAGVQVAVLKGAALLYMVYEEPALRPMVDIDLLISYGDLDASLAALQPIGYASTDPDPFVNMNGLFWNEVLLQNLDRTGSQLELHWRLLDIPYYAERLSTFELLQRADTFTFGNDKAYGLAPADLLLHLCAHSIFHHRGLLLRSDVDVAHVLARYESKIDWDLLLTTVVDLDLVLGFQQSIIRSADWWYAPVPSTVLDTVRTMKPRLRESAMLACQRSEFLKLLRTTATLPDMSHRYQYIKGQLFPSRKYIDWRYGVPATASAQAAYATRYWSGFRGLVTELTGHSPSKTKKDPG
jgi:hypothetical protein